jgi:hypothetical protein
MMNLPHPFESAKSLEVTPKGEIHLVNGKGRVLAALPLATAWSLSKGESGDGFGYGIGYGIGDGYGYGYGIGYGNGYGNGSGNGTPKKTP